MVPSGRPFCDPTVAVASGWIVEAEQKKKEKEKVKGRRGAKDKVQESEVPEDSVKKFYCKCLQVCYTLVTFVLKLHHYFFWLYVMINVLILLLKDVNFVPQI